VSEQNSSQERTEEPTARKLQKARDDGQVARSTELPAAAIVISSFLLLMLAGAWIGDKLLALFASGFVFDRKTLDTPELMAPIFVSHTAQAFAYLAPVLALTVVIAVIASGLTGGYLFAPKAIAPKASKISPIQGFKRIFGMHALIELTKAVLKFSLVSAALWWTLVSRSSELSMLGTMALEPALRLAGTMILESALAVSLALAFIAMIDVPYQKHAFTKRMRMTLQEVKDELKDMEGRPEVKAHIRRRQREMSNARMMGRVKDADVIITNPEHFAVALSYDPASDAAPILVAKGVDHMAARIREEGGTHGITLFAAPELARALYFTTEPEQPVPEPLYHAVAQVIAYVFSLEGAQPGQQPMDKPSPKVPDALRFDTDGHPLAATSGQNKA
jgi:flagellar biosynthetic protein FlhB